MNRIKRLWNTVSGKLSLDGTQNDFTGRELCRMLQRCPVCGGGFAEHSYAHFAVTVLGENSHRRVKEFLMACEENRWDFVQQFQEFDSKRDAIVAYAMRCRSGKLASVLERSPYEAYESDRLISCNVLDDAAGKQFERHIEPSDWRKMS